MKKHIEKTIVPYKQSNAKKSWKVNHRSHRMNIGSLAIFFDLIQLQVLYTAAFDPAFETISAATKLISENIWAMYVPVFYN